MRKIVVLITLICFCLGMIAPPSWAGEIMLTNPGQMVGLSQSFAPAMIRGLTVDPRKPFSFEFLMDQGDKGLSPESKTDEYKKLIRYFLASLAIPEKDLWVNLSPYEEGRIIADNFGLTEMGRDLLAEDYILKQITASLLHPDKEPGQAFWQKVYKAAFDHYGTTDVPVDTFNKVWIVPDEVEVYEEGTSVILVKSHLKVMLEADYLAQRNDLGAEKDVRVDDREETAKISREIVREVVLPILEKEVNEGENFSGLRQITASLVLATWYKNKWQDRLLNRIYSDRSKVKGIDQDPANNQKIFEQYVQAFKKGVFNFIKDDYDELAQEPLPRKYFSGGFVGEAVARSTRFIDAGPGVIAAAAPTYTGEMLNPSIQLKPETTGTGAVVPGAGRQYVPDAVARLIEKLGWSRKNTESVA